MLIYIWVLKVQKWWQIINQLITDFLQNPHFNNKKNKTFQTKAI